MQSSLLLPASQEMQELCLILKHEMIRWPGVKVGHLFGTLAFYHRKVMFAMLPDKRSLDSSDAISFIGPPNGDADQTVKWQTFELTDHSLINKALLSLQKAYTDSMSYSFSEPLTSVRPKDEVPEALITSLCNRF
jgi:hypothetical protein